MMAAQKLYLRFTIPQRLEHWAYAISFATLGITGLPQKFAGSGWAETMIALMGGIELVRVIHHIAAIVMVLAAIYHVIVLAYKVFVLRVRWTMFPRLDDALDALDAIRYNLGLSHEHPKFDRFNFAEKAEYWAGAWGTIIMALTGFIMWNPITAARVMPGDLIPASKAAHGAEAILAIGAILIWHFYNVHFKTFNKAVFTGKMTEHQMEEEHSLELERIKKGKMDPRPSPEVIKTRERTFIPIATIAAVVMLVMLFFATSYESTAITTLPRRESVQVYVPLTPTPEGAVPASNVSAATSLPADHAGRTTCLACHQNMQDPKLPADHAGRADSTCTACHKVATETAPGGATAPTTAPSGPGATTGPKPLPADHAGRTACTSCHANMTQPAMPADHAGRTDSTCTACHKPAETSAPSSPVPGGATLTPATSTGGPMPQPADHVGRTTCLACHQNLPDPKLPADHQGRTDQTCAACHVPASPVPGQAQPTQAPSTTGGPAMQPADHTGRTTCLGCHQNLPDPKLPADHAGRTDDTCAACHKPSSGSTPASAQPTTSSSSSTSGPMPVPADHVAGRTSTDCLACHATLPDPKLPADHQGRTEETCTACHKSP